MVLALCLFAAGAIQAQTESIDDAEQRLDQVDRELGALNTWLENAENRLSGLQKDISRADDEIAELNRRIRDLHGEINGTRLSLIHI